MSKRKLALVAGAAVLLGGAAFAAVGHREGRMHRDHQRGVEEFAQAGTGMGEGRWSRRGEHDGAHRDPDMRRGWLSRSLTADEFDARTRERFARIDKNNDGVIDAAEVEAEFARSGGRWGEMRDRMRQRFSSRFDADRDGKITRQEALDRARRDFDRFDLDGDGRITDADLPPMMRGRDVLKGGAGMMPGMMPGMGRGGFGLGRLVAADANKDGVITQDEFLADAGRRFDLLDRTKDGAIDKADHDTMAKEMTAWRVQRFLREHGAGKDGRLTREQFTAAAKQRFAERDANSDGRIDREDGRGGMRRGQGHHGQGMGPGDQDRQGSRDRGPPR